MDELKQKSQAKKMPRMSVLRGVAIALICYALSFSFLSFQGQYVPSSWGFGWVKWYIWAPSGFVSGLEGIEQRHFLQMVFLPLWWVDVRFIHRSEDAGSGKYPINTVLNTRLQIQLKNFEQNLAAQQMKSNNLPQKTNEAPSVGPPH